MKLIPVFEKISLQKPYACLKYYNLSLIENIVIQALMNDVLLVKNIK
jgi:hypothetical protein